MNETEKWYQSRTIWSAIGTIVVLLGGLLGYNITDEDKEAFVVAAMGLVGSVTAAISWYGRVKATKRIE